MLHIFIIKNFKIEIFFIKEYNTGVNLTLIFKLGGFL